MTRKRKWVQVVVAGLLSLWLASGVAYAQEATGSTVAKSVDTVQIEFVVPDGGLVEGENSVAVQLKDTATGKPIVQNALHLEMAMDTSDRSMNHGDMSTQKPVVAELKASGDVEGRYSGQVNLSGTGKWNAKLYIDAQRSTIIGVSVAAGGPNWLLIGGGLAGVTGLGIGGVAILKRKRTAPASNQTATEPVQL